MPGPFYFAWIPGPEEYNATYHAVEDEQIVSFQMTHAEGEFPNLQITIKNPRVGLLSRNVWAWLSRDKNWQPAGSWTPDYQPLFMGRLIGIPNTINKEMVTLELNARPINYAAQREAVADTLRVAPFWDPVFVDEQRWTDPDAVLEAYARLWHIDRVTHVVTTSDIIAGEDGTETFTPAEIPYDSVELSINTPPIRSVYVEGAVNWRQRSAGAVVLTDKSIKCLTGGSLIQDWPKPGASLGGGYIAGGDTYTIDLWRTEDAFTASSTVTWSNPNEKHNTGDTMSTSQSITWPVHHSFFTGLLTRQTEAGIGKSSVNSTTVHVMDWMVRCRLTVDYAADRSRSEYARFVMTANIQPIMTDDGDEEVHEIKVSGNDISLPLFGNDMPLNDQASASYFETDRGQTSLQYLLALGRAYLLSSARCIETKVVIPFNRAVELSCRKNAIIQDPRLPGGQAVGKIKEYGFSVDGNSGQIMGHVVIASAVGYGGAVDEVTGDPTYVEEGYVNIGYQQYDNQVVVLPGGDVGYQVPLFAGEDDGLRFPLTKEQIVISEAWSGDYATQLAAVEAAMPSEVAYANFGRVVTLEQLDMQREIAKSLIDEAIKAVPVTYSVTLKNLEGEFVNAYDVTVIPLEIPKQIDLEFSAS